jgi:flap endonuclease-1
VLALAFGTPGSAAGRPDAAEDVELALKRLDALERDDEEKPKLFNREALRAALDSRDSVARLDAGITHVRDALSAATGVRGTYVSTLLPPSDEDHAMCRDLLERMGVPVLSAPAPFEAEGFASAMALRGAVDFVGTEDSDVIVYGVS